MVTKAKLKQAKSLVTALQHLGLIQTFYTEDRENKLEQAIRVLRAFEEHQLHHFDIFRKAGFRPNENMFSDAIAALLDPNEGHGLGILPLEKLLDMLEAKDPQSQVRAVKAQLIQNQPYISVHREKREEKTIPDIEIIGSDFIIYIENKIRGGKETFIGEHAQTERQWQVLERKQKYRNMAVLAIFLTPEGKPAINPNFIPLSVGEMVTCLRDAVRATVSCPVSHSINTFLDFYTWE